MTRKMKAKIARARPSLMIDPAVPQWLEIIGGTTVEEIARRMPGVQPGDHGAVIAFRVHGHEGESATA